jgi:apolipoprotein N-acyltransferase
VQLAEETRSEEARDLPEWLNLAAVGMVFAGWFLLDTLSTTIGPIGLDFHFIDMAAIIDQPARLFTGVGSSAGGLTIVFGVLSLAVLAATLLPYVSGSRLARLARIAPLLLILVCGGLLYHETSQDTFSAAQNSGDVTAALVNLANVMARHSAGIAARHIGVGAGAWVAAVGALYLAYTGLRR